jgi:hypothetical protein
MSKPIPGAASAPVRTCPLVSTEEIRGEERKNPPVPPQAAVLVQALDLDPVPLAVRRQRVLDGSKRKRDLAAVRMADELAMLEKAGQGTAEVTATWDSARAAICDSVPESTYRLWIEPLRVAGASDDAILLAADEPRVIAQARRRYSGLIAEALRRVSSFERVEFVTGVSA